MVFSDKTLKEIVEKLPKTKEDMLKISGIGEVKYNKYGEVLKAIGEPVFIKYNTDFRTLRYLVVFNSSCYSFYF